MLLGIDASQANRKIRSGTEWYAFYLIREFKKILGKRGNLKVRLYFRGEPQKDLVADIPANFEIKILHWPLKYFWGQIRLSWEMFKNSPDILFCPAHTIPIVHPNKTYTTLHDVGFEDNPELYDRLSLWYHRWSARLAVKKALHIFTVSEFSKNRIIEFYNYPKEKLTVTYLGIAPKLSIDNFGAILEKYDLEDKNYILFVGRLEPKKNILGMVKAYEMALSQAGKKQTPSPFPPKADPPLAEIPPPRGGRRVGVDFPDLVLAGRKVRIQDVEEYLSERPELSKKIKFLNYINEQDKPYLYSGAAVFLFPTFYEGFGLPILEAQAVAVPVITSSRTSNPEIAGKGALIVDPENPQEIARAIKDLLSDESLRQEIIELGKQNLERFNWEKTAKITLRFLGILD